MTAKLTTQRMIGVDPAKGQDHSAFVEVKKLDDGTLKVERILTVPPLKQAERK